jgi:hypothetical protein
MANPTTNFGWVMPVAADLVTNLPAQFDTFGQAVDTSMSELKGGTTGQFLAKTSATNMDFTWTTIASWTNYTPTATGWTIGNGVITNTKYAQIGKIVFVVVNFNFGTTSSVTSQIRVSLPVNSVANGTPILSSTCKMSDASASQTFTGFVVQNAGNNTSVDLLVQRASGTYVDQVNVNSTIPMTWTTSDSFSLAFSYEVA